MDFSRLWGRVTEATHWVMQRWHLSEAPPWWTVILVALVIAVVCAVPVTWRITRNAMTLVHEMGHAGIAWLCGRRVSGISVHTDTSGLTITSGKPRGLGVLLTFLAGYTAPPLVGLALVWASVAGWSGAALTGIAFLLVLAFWLSRNLFGLLTVILTLAVAGFVWWQADAQVVTAFVLAAGMFLLVAGVRGVGDLHAAHRKGEGDTSDASMAAEHSLLPATIWTLFFFVVSIACLAQSVLLLARYLN